MRNSKQVVLAFLLTFMSVGVTFAQQDSVNLAPDASVTTSFVSPWETLGAVNDGVEPKSSTKAGTAYGNWNGEGDYGIYNWVQYEWTKAVNITSTAVYWWDDNPSTGVGIDQPNEAYIEYWNGAAWVNAGNIGTELNQYNQLNMGSVWAQRIRITMKSAAATGILEWKVFGQAGGDCETTEFGVSLNVNGSDVSDSGFVRIMVGDDLVLTADEQDGGQYFWNSSNGFSANGNQVSFENMQLNQSGSYTAMFINECGAISESVVYVTVGETSDGSAYTWPAYDPPIYYDFRDEFPTLEMPTKDLDDCANVAGRKSSEWWTFVWGPNRRQEVTDLAIDNMLERFNKDFAYFRDTMGWPPDHRAKNGYRSAIYLFGSGLCTDNADTNALGGWMGNITYQGENWPMVLASYFPVSRFDPKYPDDGSMGAMIHEGIHALLADLPGAKNSAWFQEGGNTWLQQEMEVRKSGVEPQSMGFLNVGALIAPFMPIECYSGWLQDESFGGPSAEGVNMGDENGQICTWKSLLGGTQYGNTFPIVFSQIFGDHSVAWIWRYCENRVLEGIADTLGDYQTRRMIMEYRAKMAMLDLGMWSKAARNTIDGSFGFGIGAEWQPSWLNPRIWNATPYVITSDDGTGLLTPEYRTTPGWSGANQIPLIVNSDTVSVEFLPIGKNMSCQLCYRATDGSVVYGEPVLAGECKLALDKQPANNVVVAVICNTDYIYEGEKTRKAHFDYKLRMGKGIKERGNWKTKWYHWDSNLTNSTVPVSTVNFYVNTRKIDLGSSVRFSDQSTNVVRDYFWDFGDGTTSTEENPEHTYDTAGTYTISLTVTGTNGSITKTRTDYVTVTSTTGINKVNSDKKIQVFPNPVTSEKVINIKFGNDLTSPAEIRLTDINGRLVAIKNTTSNTTLACPDNVSKGVYFVSVKTGDDTEVHKLVVQ
ncbi:PKD domain-containing protein [Saccharicrinis sp. FJH54]|uniref:PKD domain-containing protein n=1 Tax=Saccharicrinis sp. FJH54 TaxID=3344665 RepID=UPI0035D462B6